MKETAPGFNGIVDNPNHRVAMILYVEFIVMAKECVLLTLYLDILLAVNFLSGANEQSVIAEVFMRQAMNGEV